ncbi:ankyrin repeat domain-containing protein [Legionella hackeliae]|uniref:Uncharacterized protein n=1 Tax=Legionella hackeliae TaxID=449 RepID=A0A0A8UWU6_LEGHA|nr:ankyrin repeat domain-containing protein [Legionella hackeliae]KTD12595.1 Ankyrin repeats (3 copies) [Legionella hackeliae]CEK12011.1 protein of unknown function [ankyrin domain] [Legionella hackeliae]STX48794.1 Ribulose-5-phosphate 4-epimerase and related epimerases and aldolases [Legionella hackeliae]
MKRILYKTLGWSLETTFTSTPNASFRLTTLSSFFAAVHHRDLPYLKVLVQKLQFDLTQKDEQGRTLLHKIVSERLDFPLVYTNSSSQDELFHYISEGKYDELKVLLNQKPLDLNHLFKDRTTPLQLAIISKKYQDIWTRINIIKLLLNHGAYPNLAQLPLLSICYHVHGEHAVPIIEVLGSYCADVSLRITNELTVLSEVALDGNEQLVLLLMKLGANPHTQEHYRASLYKQITTDSFARYPHRVTPFIRTLISQIEMPKEPIGGVDLEEIIAFFKHCGSNLDAQDLEQNTPLHFANSYEAFKALLENGATTNSTNCRQETPLHSAVARNFFGGFVEKLLQNGAQINAQDANGFTPLRKAIHVQGYSSTAESLLQHGADFTIADQKGITPFIATIIEKKSQITQQLITMKANVNEYSPPFRCYPIHLALDPQYYDFTIVKHLVAADASLLRKNEDGKNAFDIVKANMDKYSHYGFKSVFCRFFEPRKYNNGVTDYGVYETVLDIPHLQAEKGIYGLERLIRYRTPFLPVGQGQLETSDILRHPGIEIVAQLLMQITRKSLEEEFCYLLRINLIQDFLPLWQLLLDLKQPKLQKLLIAYVKNEGNTKMLHDMLRIAIIDSDVEMVTFLLQDNDLQKMINDNDSQGKTMLHDAILNIEIHSQEINTRRVTENYKYIRPKKPIKKPGKVGIQDTAKTIELLVGYGADVNVSYLGKLPLLYATSVSRFLMTDAVADIVSTLLKAQAKIEPVWDLLFDWMTSDKIKYCYCKFFIEQEQWENLFLVINQHHFNFNPVSLYLNLKEMQNFAQALTKQPQSSKLIKIQEELATLYQINWQRHTLTEQIITGKYQDVEGYACREKLKAIGASNNWTGLFKHTTSEAILLVSNETLYRL